MTAVMAVGLHLIKGNHARKSESNLAKLILHRLFPRGRQKPQFCSWQNAVKLLVICLLLVHAPIVAEPEHDDHEGVTKPIKPPAKPGGGSPATSERGPRCGVNPLSLANFANGEGADMPSMVNFLTSPECVESGRSVSAAAMASGIRFSSTGPLKLENYARNLSFNDYEGMKRLESNLSKSVPPILRQNPMSPRELMPLLGQLAVLSPTAARTTLVNIIQQELYTADSLITNETGQRRQKLTAELAKTLVRMGANESLIATEMAEAVEDLALLAQADSLAKYFRSLGAATTAEASLAPTFNLSANALNRGVQKGKKIYVASDKSQILKSVFWAIRSAMGGADALEAGAVELNEALGSLLNGYPLQATSLKLAYQEAIKVLVQTNTQGALADAVAASLTPDMAFLPADDVHLLLVAARTYPVLAYSIQSNFLLAYEAVWASLHDAKLTPQKFNSMREKFFIPLVASILDWGPTLVDSRWLRQVWRRGLVNDDDIEKRFPRFMLAFLEKRERAVKKAGKESSLESSVGVMAENMAVLWTLSNTHVPALMDWVKKYEDQ